MRVYTDGVNPKLTANELRFATRFMYRYLVSDRIHNKTHIWVESKEIWHKNVLEGEVSAKDMHRHPKRFKILLNSRFSKKRQLIALAHELVHVKQFTKNELGDSVVKDKQNFTRWKRRMVNESKMSYWDLPWEIEAHGREYGLYKRYINFLKLNDIRF